MHDVLVDHPINDPELISYVRPELSAIMSELERVRDCYDILRGDDVKSRYLPQEIAEPDESYEARLSRATYAPVFRDAIRAFAGLLGNYQEADLPKTLEDNLENVDMMGSSLSKFLNHLDQEVLRDGGCAVLVEMPAEGGYESALEEQQAGQRPYLVSVKRQDIINWRTSIIGGREIVVQAVVRTVQEMPSDEGQFGTKLEPIYCLFTPGAYKKIRLVRNSTSRWTMEVIEEGLTSLPIVPLVWYGATGSRFGVGEVPLAGLADLSLQHYQLRSDLGELLHKLSMPVPVRKGASTDSHGRYPALTIGPNTAIDLPEEGDFSFAEPSGSSLQRHQEEISHVEALMDRSSLAFMYGSQTTKTATEAILHGSQIQAQIATLIENKESSFDMIVKLWSRYTGETITPESGIEVSPNLLQRPMESQEVQAMMGLFGENAISHELLLFELQRGHVISQDLDIEEELAKVAKEKKEAQKEAMAMMQQATPGPEQFAPKAEGDDSPPKMKKPPAAGNGA